MVVSSPEAPPPLEGPARAPRYLRVEFDVQARASRGKGLEGLEKQRFQESDEAACNPASGWGIGHGTTQPAHTVLSSEMSPLPRQRDCGKASFLTLRGEHFSRMASQPLEAVSSLVEGSEETDL